MFDGWLKTNRFCKVVLLFVAMLLISACSPPAMQIRQTVNDSSLELIDFSSEEFDDYAVKSLPEENFERFESLMLTPITLRVTEQRWQSLNEKDKRRLFTDFQREYRAAFDDVEQTQDPDKSTLIVHTYVTELRPSDPSRNFAPFIIGELDLGAAVFETEAVDNTGRVVAVARGVYNGKPLIEGYSTWDVVRHAVRAWLKNTRRLLEQTSLL